MQISSSLSLLPLQQQQQLSSSSIDTSIVDIAGSPKNQRESDGTYAPLVTDTVHSMAINFEKQGINLFSETGKIVYSLFTKSYLVFNCVFVNRNSAPSC